MNTKLKNLPVCAVSGETPIEELANFFTHGIGLIISVIGFIFLMGSAFFSENIWITISCLIYGVTLVLLFLASTLYHHCKEIKKKQRLRIFDHTCIYLLIAGSYTPVIFYTFENSQAILFSIIIWSVACIGIILKMFFTGRFEILSTFLYLLMGWGCVVVIKDIMDSLQEGFILLMSGGMCYTLGVIFFLWKKLPFNHSIWHLFVMGGSACHYCLVTFYIAGA
ncbi:MAG: hemolysin III family protein [Parachlamydiaceae bacterium]|nr:hemolysin III family protein [Parachlamydiaceae bacterium]